MKIYGISGLGADKRVFQYLALDCEFIPIDWIEPLRDEHIEDYSLRLAKIINQNENFGILGVSFGGLIATEISKKIKPKLTILISSAETKRELRWIYRVIGRSGLINIIPARFIDLPRIIAYWLFGTEKRELLKSILDDSDLKFTKWAIKELTSWRNIESLDNCIKISGSRDKLIPPAKNKKEKLIKGGQHFMIVDRANEISKIINETLMERFYASTTTV